LPGDRVQHLTVEEALHIHESLIERFGGEPGVRDPGLLESALFRPRTGYYADLAEMAAALFESLLINHPFVDGNKRAAFFATDVFLRLNGYRLEVEAGEAATLLEDALAEGTADYAHLLPWIRGALREL
jgi:death-on-curing protein